MAYFLGPPGGGPAFEKWNGFGKAGRPIVREPLPSSPPLPLPVPDRRRRGSRDVSIFAPGRQRRWTSGILLRRVDDLGGGAPPTPNDGLRSPREWSSYLDRAFFRRLGKLLPRSTPAASRGTSRANTRRIQLLAATTRGRTAKPTDSAWRYAIGPRAFMRHGQLPSLFVRFLLLGRKV